MGTAVAEIQAESLPRQATEQVSYSGTPRFRDQTQPDDYVRDLAEPTKRMEIFDEMRASDEGINTAISAREQLIGSASWQLTSPDDSDAGREINEFCEDNIYPHLGDLLRHLAGAMQYGFGVVETVFAWSDGPFARNIARGKVRRPTKQMGRKVYLRKLAHIRQRTIQTFVVPQGGDLTFLRQYVWDGFTLKKTDIPADKVLMWTYNRRGDDYWGTPPARHAYRAWKFKMQLERLNLLGFDRFGTGTPVITAGDGWSDLEYEKAQAFARYWRSGQESHLVVPPGGQIDIKGGNGPTIISALEWVKWYNIAIAKTFLTQGTELGSTETGARALGETFYDQTGSVVQSDCEDIANILNERLIVPLVNWNFGEQKDYPRFIPSQRVKLSPAIAQVIQGLVSAGAVKWDPSDEVWLRDKLDLPDIDLDARAEREEEEEEEKKQEQQAALPAPRPQLALPPGTQPSKDNSNQPAKAQLRALSLNLTDGAPEPARNGETTHRTREYSEWESRILRPDLLIRDLDVQNARLTGEVHEVLREIDAELERDAASLALQGSEQIASGIRNVQVSAKLRNKLRKVMLEAAERSRIYGSNSVHSEVARQEAPEAIGPQRGTEVGFFKSIVAGIRQLAQPAEPTPEERLRDLRVRAEVDRAVEDEIDRREQSVRNNLLTAIAMAGALSVSRLVDVVRIAVAQALESLSTGRTESNVAGVVNVSFGVGRSEAAGEIVARAKQAPVNRPDISPRPGAGFSDDGGGPGVIGHIPRLVKKVYSAVMDFGTCDECAKWDGGDFPLDYPEDLTGVQAPNPRCHGSYSKCRCIWIYVTEREAESNVPASRGPLPLPPAPRVSEVGFSRSDERAVSRSFRQSESRERVERQPTINVTMPEIRLPEIKMPDIRMPDTTINLTLPPASPHQKTIKQILIKRDPTTGDFHGNSTETEIETEAA